MGCVIAGGAQPNAAIPPVLSDKFSVAKTTFYANSPDTAQCRGFLTLSGWALSTGRIAPASGLAMTDDC